VAAASLPGLVAATGRPHPVEPVKYAAHLTVSQIAYWIGVTLATRRPSIEHRYLMTSPTMIQARVAITTLPANISGKKRPHPSLCQGLRVGTCGQMALWEKSLACRLFATLGMTCILASVSLWGRLEAINGHFPLWSLGRVSVPHSPHPAVEVQASRDKLSGRG
jgi:hypothetical protein